MFEALGRGDIALDVAKAYGISVSRVRKEIARAPHDVALEGLHDRRPP